MTNFSEAERRCQTTFDMCGDVYHMYTSGRDTPILFTTCDDMIFVMNVIAYAAHIYKDTIRIVAFEVMDNHFHFVVCGSPGENEAFYQFIVRKIKRSIPEVGNTKMAMKRIDSLSALRNNIVYTNRNGYVANPNVTPYSYPWGTGRYYFNTVDAYHTFGEISYVQNRKMFRGGNVNLPSNWQMTGGFVSPSCFCSIDLGMAMFRDAHHYFVALTKNVESYSELAIDIDDSEFLTDQELFGQVSTIIRDQYHLMTQKDLSKAQRLDIARILRFKYKSSNGQIRRVLGLSQYELDTLFPR